MIVHNSEVRPSTPAPGITRRVLARGGGMMIVEVRFAAGTLVAEHAHPHEQASYVVSGRIVVTMEGKDETLGTGDSFYVAPNVPHSVRLLEDSIVTDTFTPQRQDFL
ncbi:MAG TPA: cupin domain-containing protein [bacterium]|nr:cupin domain-containing protein [bacterium]